jgi:hypothetical protein
VVQQRNTWFINHMRRLSVGGSDIKPTAKPTAKRTLLSSMPRLCHA